MLASGTVAAERPDSLSLLQPEETSPEQPRFMHRIGLEYRPEWIAPTNDFLAGRNRAQRPIDFSHSAHLRYSLQFRPGSCSDRVYGGAYQGFGVARYAFGNRRELGDPTGLYLFQGARIARLAPRLSLNYEWNFGLAFGWVPYDKNTNKFNLSVGSKLTAYLNVDFYLDWRLTRRLDLNAGVTLTHFSNGNTEIPNGGLNGIGAKVGLVYNFGRVALALPQRGAAPAFARHMSYDVILFGSWRRTGVKLNGKMYVSPDAYPVVGFNFTPMFNFNYKFRAGLSLDGVWDGSANVYTEDYVIENGGRDPGHTFYKPSIDRQLTLGVSARAEFVMPYFSINLGLGVNVLHKGGDLKSYYQILALKIGVTRSSFLHIGYCLKDFHTPNFLMLGVGYRFNNKYPRLK